MTSKSPIPPWAIHLFYWLLLTGIFIYFIRQNQEQLRTQRAIGSCLPAACEAINRQNEQLMADINRNADNFRYDIAEAFRMKALWYCYQNTMLDMEIIPNAMTPTLSPRKYGLKTGELFEADIFLSGYSPAQHYTEATVNGESFPVRDGMLQFKRIFEKPGEHPLTVILKYENPLTGEVKSFLKTFYVYIRP